MSTNYYFKDSREKEIEDYVNENAFFLKDFILPRLHIGKRACGWLPSFEKTEFYSNIKELEDFYIKNQDSLIIVDENENELSWDDLKNELINWNGGDNISMKECNSSNRFNYIDDQGYDWCSSEFG